MKTVREKRRAGVTIFALSVVAGLAATTVRAQDAAVPQTLNDSTFQHWRDFIHPTDAESAWERNGWQTSLWAGLTLAQAKRQPLMVWFMTGHPCGMT